MAEKKINNTGEEKIKLLIVINTLGVGGAEVQVAHTIPYINKDKFDVQLAYYSEKCQGHPAKVLAEANVKVTFLNRDKWGRIPYFFKTARFMKQHRFDIVHAWTGTANLYARVPAIIAGVPCIIGGLRGRRTANGRNGLAYSLTNWRCSGWIVNSPEIKEIAKRKLKFIKNSPIYVVRNGLEVNDDKRFLRDKHCFYDALKSNKPVIGTVSRLAPVKNQLLFVEMAKHLSDAGIEADFWIIGEGPMRPALEKAIIRYNLENTIKLLGYRTDVDSALSRMDVFVLTSDSEGCPNSLLEAMRASLPVVSTNCGYLNDIIEEGSNGYISPKGDAHSLTQKIKILLNDPDKRKKMGKHSKEIVEKRFSMQIAVQKLQETYIECLKRCGRKYPEISVKLQKLGPIS